jgi:hypothetical protein
LLLTIIDLRIDRATLTLLVPTPYNRDNKGSLIDFRVEVGYTSASRLAQVFRRVV